MAAMQVEILMVVVRATGGSELAVVTMRVARGKRLNRCCHL